jgi:ABC-type uncharacterized transport system substrate-binding protein
MESYRPGSKTATIAGALGLLAVAGAYPAHAHPHVWVSVETKVLIEQGSIVGFRHRWTFDEFYTAMAIQGLDTNNDGVYSREELAELAQVNIDGLKDFKFFTFARLGTADVEAIAPKDFWLEHVTGPPGTASPQAGGGASPQVAVPAAGNAGTAAEGDRPGLLKRMWKGVFGGDGEQAKPAPEPPKVLALEFTLPLRQPVLIDAPDFNFAIYDPSWFIAFDVPNADAVKLGAGAPDSCRITSADDATPGSPPADNTQRLEDAFNSKFGGAGTATLSGTKLFRINCGPKS